MKRSRTFFRPRTSAALTGVAVAVSALLTLACVTMDEHERVLRERNLALEKIERLEAGAESLDADRVALAEEIEDLRIEHGRLQSSLDELASSRTELVASLAERERQLEAQNSEVAELRSTYDELVGNLQSEVAAGRIEIEQLRDGLKVKLAQAILFPSGSAKLSTGGQGVIAKLAEQFLTLPHQVDVEGHSDDRPIRGGRYPSNWELAGARAASVVRVLIESGVPATRLRVISNAHTKPVADNGTTEGRARNRRIEIRLRSTGPGASTEAPASE